jgi:transposase-like protein
MQTCIVHLIRAALRFVSWADRKAVAGALKPLYTAENEDAAVAELEKLEQNHGDKYPTVIRTFRGRWEQFVPFLSYPQEIRRMLYTTNAVESLNSQLRKVLRNRGPFPERGRGLQSPLSRDPERQDPLASEQELDSRALSARHLLRRTSACVSQLTRKF